METSHKIHDPFLNKEVEISSRLTDRLRGRYASGPTLANGEPEFGWRQFETPPIQHEAAAHIEQLHIAIKEACDLLAERTYGNEARSPGHNARLKLEAAVSSVSRPQGETP
jgi:hypothetical protein